MELGAEAFGERPLLRSNIGREAIRSLARRPGSLAVVDRTAGRREVSASRADRRPRSASFPPHPGRTVPERRVGIVLPPGAGAVIANLAVVCAGKVPVNLNFTASRAAVESSAAESDVVTVLTADAMRSRLADFPWPARSLDLRAEIANAGGAKAMIPWIMAAWLLPNQWVASLVGIPPGGNRDEAALLFTSGSGGSPKGVVLSHRNLLAELRADLLHRRHSRQKCVMLGCLSRVPQLWVHVHDVVPPPARRPPRDVAQPIGYARPWWTRSGKEGVHPGAPGCADVPEAVPKEGAARRPEVDRTRGVGRGSAIAGGPEVEIPGGFQHRHSAGLRPHGDVACLEPQPA